MKIYAEAGLAIRHLRPGKTTWAPRLRIRKTTSHPQESVSIYITTNFIFMLQVEIGLPGQPRAGDGTPFYQHRAATYKFLVAATPAEESMRRLRPAVLCYGTLSVSIFLIALTIHRGAAAGAARSSKPATTMRAADMGPEHASCSSTPCTLGSPKDPPCTGKVRRVGGIMSH